jgi:hypothetical protein
MKIALIKFELPDADSRTKDNEGRRIETIEGGWLILNYQKYRAQAQAQDGGRAPYFRAYRARKRAEATFGVTHNSSARDLEDLEAYLRHTNREPGEEG